MKENHPAFRSSLRRAREACFTLLRTLGVLALANASLSFADSLTFNTGKDVTAKFANPGTNYGTETTVQASNQTCCKKQFFIQFTVSGVPAGATNVTAQVKLRAEFSGSSRSVSAHSVSDTSWTETGLTWNNKPSLGTALSTVSTHTSGQDSVFDVTAAVPGDGTYAFGFDSTYTSGDLLFDSRENTTAPRLVVTYTPPPAIPPGAGIAFTWPDPAFDGENASVVRVRQGYMKWKDIAPTSASLDQDYHNYVWTLLDQEVTDATSHGQKIMLQVNSGAPSWVFDKVAQVGFSRGEKAPQYWDPDYVSYYLHMIKALADKIKSYTATQRALFVGVRVQPLAFNTEISNWGELSEGCVGSSCDVNSSVPLLGPDGPGDRSKWVLHAGDTAFGPDLGDIKTGTTTYQQDYLQQIIDKFYTEFTTGVLAGANGIYTTVREPNLTKILGASYVDGRYALPYSMGLDAGCEVKVLNGSHTVRLYYDYLDNRCRTDGKRGYWEDYKESTFNDGGAHSPVDGNQYQEFYWRQLAKLDAGVCYGAVYGKDMTLWNSDPGTQGYKIGVDFFNTYAAQYLAPASSPGAWIAFMFVDTANGSPARPQLGYFISHLNSGDASVSNDSNVSIGNGDTNYQGAWARRFGTGATAQFSLLGAFANSLSAGYDIKVTWHASTSATWSLYVRNGTGTPLQIGGSVSGGGASTGWITTTFSNVGPVPAGDGTLGAPDFKITNTAGNAYFHMIEIVK